MLSILLRLLGRFLMAILKFIFDVVGGTPAVFTAVPVDAVPLVLDTNETKSMRFRFDNGTDRDIVFTRFAVEVDSPLANKVTVTTPASLSVSAGGSAEGAVQVTATEPVFEGETGQIRITGFES